MSQICDRFILDYSIPKNRPRSANHMLFCLRKMMNMADKWEYRDDGPNFCRHLLKCPENGRTRLLNDAEVGRIFA